MRDRADSSAEARGGGHPILPRSPTIRAQCRHSRHSWRPCDTAGDTNGQQIGLQNADCVVYVVPNARTRGRRCRDPEMTEKLPDVWAARDFPVLVAAAQRFDEGEPVVRVSHLVADTSLAVEDVARACRALDRRGLVEMQERSGGGPVARRNLSGDAYFLTGLHPDGDDAVSQLVSALRQAADHTSDPAEKGKLRTLADNAGAVSRDVLAGVLTAVITGGVSG